MAWYVYPPMVALDPQGNLIRSASLTFHAESDTSGSTPLALTDLNGLAKSTVLVNDLGLTQAFRAEVPEGVLRSGSLVSAVSSPKGMREAAEKAVSDVEAFIADSAARLLPSPLGSLGQVATVGASGPEWTNPTGGGGSGTALVLDPGDDVPPGTPVGTIIYRVSGVTPPPGDIAIVTETLTRARSNSSASLTIDRPSGVADGDLLVAVLHSSQSATADWTASGWTVLHSVDFSPTTTNARITTWLALPVPSAGSLAGSSWTFSTGQAAARAIGYVFRVTGADLSNPLLATLPAVDNPSGVRTFTFPTWTVAEANSLILAEFHGQATSTTTSEFPTILSDGSFTKYHEWSTRDDIITTRSPLSLVGKVSGAVAYPSGLMMEWPSVSSPYGTGIILRGA